jgi:hypothetical protein
MDVSNSTKIVAGVLLITVPSVEFGGSFLLRMLKRAERGYMDRTYRTYMTNRTYTTVRVRKTT